MEQLLNGDYIFQQDGARLQTSKVTFAYLEEHCRKFLKPDFWPPNSPGINPWDYAIWGTLEAKIWKHNRFHITTLEDLKEWIVEEWNALPQDVISRAINSFEKRIRMVTKKNGRHMEKHILTDKQHFYSFQLLIYSSERKILDFFNYICFLFNCPLCIKR